MTSANTTNPMNAATPIPTLRPRLRFLFCFPNDDWVPMMVKASVARLGTPGSFSMIPAGITPVGILGWSLGGSGVVRMISPVSPIGPVISPVGYCSMNSAAVGVYSVPICLLVFTTVSSALAILSWSMICVISTGLVCSLRTGSG